MNTIKKNNQQITPEVIKLALSWTNDDISLADVARKLNTVNMTQAYTTLARALKDYIKNK